MQNNYSQLVVEYEVPVVQSLQLLYCAHFGYKTHSGVSVVFWNESEAFSTWNNNMYWVFLEHFGALSMLQNLSLTVHVCVAFWAEAVISFSHACEHWYCSIGYDLNVHFLYGEL